jgi:hypothetical protein
MQRYQFVVGASVTALEEAVNRIVSDEPCLKLSHVIYAQGTGFVAVVERLESAKVAQTQGKKQPEKPATNQQRSGKKA